LCWLCVSGTRHHFAKYINDLKFTCFSYARVSQKCTKQALFPRFVAQNSYGDIVSIPWVETHFFCTNNAVLIMDLPMCIMRRIDLFGRAGRLSASYKLNTWLSNKNSTNYCVWRFDTQIGPNNNTTKIACVLSNCSFIRDLNLFSLRGSLMSLSPLSLHPHFPILDRWF